jgi:hypothetical protein
MNRIWSAAKRIWRSTFNICGAVIGKATRGAGTAIKTTGGAIAAILAIIVVAAFAIVIFLASIPWGLFGREHGPSQEVATQTN